MPLLYRRGGPPTLSLRSPPLHPLGFADETVRVDFLYGADPREGFHLPFGQLPAAHAEVVVELLQRAGPYYGGGNPVLPEEPVERDLGVAPSCLLGDPAYHVERGPVALRGPALPVLFHRLDSAGDARVFGWLLATPVLP